MMLSPVSQPQLALIKHIREKSTTRVWCFEILYVLQQSFTFIEKKIFYPAINQQSVFNRLVLSLVLFRSKYFDQTHFGTTTI